MRTPMTEQEHSAFAEGLQKARDALMWFAPLVEAAHRPRCRQKRAVSVAIRAIQKLRVEMDAQWLADGGDETKRSPYLR